MSIVVKCKRRQACHDVNLKDLDYRIAQTLQGELSAAIKQEIPRYHQEYRHSYATQINHVWVVGRAMNIYYQKCAKDFQHLQRFDIVAAFVCQFIGSLIRD
jgi:hypothetical protein